MIDELHLPDCSSIPIEKAGFCKLPNPAVKERLVNR